MLSHADLDMLVLIMHTSGAEYIAPKPKPHHQAHYDRLVEEELLYPIGPKAYGVTPKGELAYTLWMEFEWDEGSAQRLIDMVGGVVR